MTKPFLASLALVSLFSVVVLACSSSETTQDVGTVQEVGEGLRAGSGSGCCSCKSGAVCSHNSQLECGTDGACAWLASDYPASCASICGGGSGSTAK